MASHFSEIESSRLSLSANLVTLWPQVTELLLYNCN